MRSRENAIRLCIPLAATLLALAGLASGQTPPDHAKHHPAPGGAGAAPAGTAAPAGMPMPGGNPAGTAPGGMGGGMGEMMKEMGKPPTKEVYPSLMALPELSPERRAEIDAQATQQINEGVGRLDKGSESLSRATQAGDHTAMQQSVVMMRDGLAELEAGLAARQVLSEGKAPRNLALTWFKREMNLALPVEHKDSHLVLGVAPFHLFTMVLLIAFALAMVAMYFFKMRRAAALFGRLDPDEAKSPPPGESKPLAGKEPPPDGAPAPDKEPPPPDKEPPSPPPGKEPPASPPGKEAPAPPPGKESPPGKEAPAPSGGDATTTAGRADELWKERGRPVGSPEIDWLRAEKELANTPEKLPVPPAAGSSPAPPAAPPAASEATSVPPVTANWRGQLRVGSIVTETPSVKTLRLLPSSNDRLLPFTFLPGQFLNLSFGIGGAKMNRSYSISSSPTQREYVELTVRREPRGAVSRHIADLVKVGAPIEAGGPVGKFTFTGAESNSVVLISAGVGITPMMSAARYLTERSWAGDIYFIYTCRTPTDFIFAEEIAALERRNPKLHVAVTISKPEGTDWKGARGRISKDWLTQTVPDLASRRIHLCGPPSMMDAVKVMLTELGVPPDNLKTEAFGTPKPVPAAAGTSAKPAAAATGPLVTFSKNNKSAKIHTDQTILELSEELGIAIEFSCRVGTCGVCKVKMTSGEVEMAVEDALEPNDKTEGMILACQAKPKGEVAVEA